MLALLFTYHQVLPIFLDFLFPFGAQDYAKDFYFSGFRRDERYNNPTRINEVPTLGRSGRDFHLCYNLRSVETTLNPPEWPWTIRQTAIYHSFDLGTGRSFWTMVKGKRSIRERITNAVRSKQCSELTSFCTVQNALTASLATHLILCEWARENWARYISFLERQFQQKTRHAIEEPVVGHTKRFTTFDLGPRSNTMPPIARRSTLSVPGKGQFQRIKRAMTSKPFDTFRTPIDLLDLDQATGVSSMMDNDENGFSFSDLQHIQHIEEKSNESLLVIRSNVSIMSELREYYSSTYQAEGFPADLKEGARMATARFMIRVGSIINDLQLQQSRLETLLRLLSDRKSMVELSTLDVFRNADT